MSPRRATRPPAVGATRRSIWRRGARVVVLYQRFYSSSDVDYTPPVDVLVTGSA